MAKRSESSSLTLPLPPAHPMVVFSPATRLVGMAVKWRLVVVGVCATAAAINVAQTKREFESWCILRVCQRRVLRVELDIGRGDID